MDSTGPEPGPLWFDRCRLCTHATGEEACRAFPSGIPAEIYSGDFDHVNPFPGDNGIRFARKE